MWQCNNDNNQVTTLCQQQANKQAVSKQVNKTLMAGCRLMFMTCRGSTLLTLTDQGCVQGEALGLTTAEVDHLNGYGVWLAALGLKPQGLAPYCTPTGTTWSYHWDHHDRLQL